MLENLLIIALVILSIIMISVILLQPDRSQGLAKSSANILDEEKEGIENPLVPSGEKEEESVKLKLPNCLQNKYK